MYHGPIVPGMKFRWAGSTATITVRDVDADHRVWYENRWMDEATFRDLVEDIPAHVTDHLAVLCEDFTRMLRGKYINGYFEHGGDLRTKHDIPWLLAQIEAEVLDLFVYVRTLRERLEGR
jgi:hypothetical protein